MLTHELQIAERAKKYKQEALTNLHQFIDEDLLKKSYHSLNKNSSPGVDGKFWHNYSLESQFRFPELLGEFKSGKYQAPNIRRVYIPKGKTGKRPLGIPTIEDKILQESVRRVLTPLYEEDFKDFSYGFRRGYSAHQAIDYMFKEVSFKKTYHIIDADIQNYFGSIDHGMLREILVRRMKDGVIDRMIAKWLKAGILEGKQLTYPKEGTPQGGTVSPVLSNIYLHHVLDEWFSEETQPLLKGRSFIVRYADDFVLGFEHEEDAKRVMGVLSKRFAKYNLVLHPDKTRLINLDSKERGNRSFDFLGFTHFLGSTRKGELVLKRKTSSKKLTVSITKVAEWIKRNRHRKLKEVIYELNMKLRGHYAYYGITFNYRSLNSFRRQVENLLHKWLNRRGGKPSWQWERFVKLITIWYPLFKPKIYHSYQSAKPILRGTVCGKSAQPVPQACGIRICEGAGR